MERNTATADTDFQSRVTHGYADSDGVKIHYASLGTGPLILAIHGFPDYWYTWRHQMEALAPHYQVVALDLRGYNLSDKPKGRENYDMSLFLGDVQAVIRHLGQEKAIIVGHDWGGAISWQFAIHLPAMTERLIILNSPHPRGFMRELVHNPQQQLNSQYARDFQQSGAHQRLTPTLVELFNIQPSSDFGQLTPELLSGWVTDSAAKEDYIQAFQRSDIEAMLHYYQQNYPREPYMEDTSPVIKVQAPVLMVYGLQDKYLLPGALNNTWEWVEKDLTLVTVPESGHFVQHDAADLVTRTLISWLSC